MRLQPRPEALSVSTVTIRGQRNGLVEVMHESDGGEKILASGWVGHSRCKDLPHRGSSVASGRLGGQSPPPAPLKSPQTVLAGPPRKSACKYPARVVARFCLAPQSTSGNWLEPAISEGLVHAESVKLYTAEADLRLRSSQDLPEAQRRVLSHPRQSQVLGSGRREEALDELSDTVEVGMADAA